MKSRRSQCFQAVNQCHKVLHIRRCGSPRLASEFYMLSNLSVEVSYSRVPNKCTGAFNRTEEKKQPELISVQCTINIQRGLNCQN